MPIGSKPWLVVLCGVCLAVLALAVMPEAWPASKAGKTKSRPKGAKKNPGPGKQKSSPGRGPTMQLATLPHTQREEVYKRVRGTELKMHIFEPARKEPGRRYPAIVFFFSGGWTQGSPSSFFHQCRYLAGRGMIAMSAGYRVASRQPGTTPLECVKDAKSAIRWVRANADRLGVDPGRIAAAGGSAGGHVAAASALAPGYDEQGENLAVSCRADALVLFNPYLGALEERSDSKDAKVIPALRPINNIRAGAPPTIIIGSTDEKLAGDNKYIFQNLMKAAGNRCEVRNYEGQPHGFYNWDEQPNHHFFYLTLADADKFLASLGWLQGEPTLK